MSTSDDERPLRLVTDRACDDQVRHHDPERPVYGYEPAESPLTRAIRARDRADRSRDSYARHVAGRYLEDPADPELKVAAELYREAVVHAELAQSVVEVEFERQQARRRAGATAGDVV